RSSNLVCKEQVLQTALALRLHPFSMWGSIFVDETMAVAAADRLIHHGYMFELKGESYRKKTAKAVTSAT
ncbi:ATP-binding protein, partial [Escherichia coli]|uniref:ATP-binding protein n=3 Tax=Escherichia coli TaxID=562 RepID=UPI0031B63CD1